MTLVRHYVIPFHLLNLQVIDGNLIIHYLQHLFPELLTMRTGLFRIVFEGQMSLLSDIRATCTCICSWHSCDIRSGEAPSCGKCRSRRWFWVATFPQQPYSAFSRVACQPQFPSWSFSYFITSYYKSTFHQLCHHFFYSMSSYSESSSITIFLKLPPRLPSNCFISSPVIYSLNSFSYALISVFSGSIFNASCKVL